MLTRFNSVSLLLLVTAHSALAETQKFAATAQVAPATGIGAVSSMSAALLAVPTLVFVLAWVMRRFKLPGQNNASGLKVIQAVSLGPKERAVLVQLKDRQLLVGVAPGTVNLLCDLGEGSADGVAIETGTQTSAQTVDSQASSDMTPSFKAILKRSLGMQ